jgi:hypothetical protein
MINKTTEHQAKVYVYDLNNCASEFGFKNDEGWQLTAVTDSRKKELEKQYYPTVSVKVLPETLAELFTMVKERALQLRSGFVNAIENANTPDQTLQYIVAYSLNRPLR